MTYYFTDLNEHASYWPLIIGSKDKLLLLCAQNKLQHNHIRNKKHSLLLE